MSAGACLGFAATLGAYFAISNFTGDRSEDETSMSHIVGSSEGAVQDSSTRFANESKTASMDSLSVDMPLEDVWTDWVSDEYPNVTQLADLVQIAKQWMDEAGFDVIQRINDSLTNPIVQNAVIGSIVHHAAQTDAESALQHALKLSGPVRDLALEAVAAAWVSLNPIQALNAMSAIKEGSVRRQMLEKLVRAWAEHDPTTVLEDLGLVPENLRKLGERQALLTLARTDPEGTVALLQNIEDKELRVAVTKELASNWSDRDVHAALEWALSDDIPIKQQVLTVILGKMARENHSLALQTALSQPLEDSLVGLELTVIGEVAAIDLELAVEMLSQVREGITKFFSYSTLGKYLARNNDIDRVHSLALELPEREREAYYNQVVHQWAASQPESLVAQLDNLPSTDNKYQAAMNLVRRNVGTNVLSRSQMEYVRDFLPEDYNSETGRRNRQYSNPGLTKEQAEQIQTHYRRVLEEQYGELFGERVRAGNGETETESKPL